MTPIRIGWRCSGKAGDKHTVYLSVANSLLITPMCCGRYMEPLDPDQWAALDAAVQEANKALGLFHVDVTVWHLMLDVLSLWPNITHTDTGA
jgi:hypothetical protein